MYTALSNEAPIILAIIEFRISDFPSEIVFKAPMTTEQKKIPQSNPSSDTPTEDPK